MSLSLYSFVMATLWFTAFILLGSFLQRKAGFAFCYRLTPLLFLLGLTVFRLLAPIELPFARVLRSDTLYPAVRDLLRMPLAASDGPVFTFASALLGVWAVGAVFLCGRLLLLVRRDARYLARLSALPCPEGERCLARLLSRRGSGRRVRLLVSAEVSSPMLTGLFRPTILLPADCVNLSGAGLECILNHELTHLSGHDLWVKLIIRLLCCVLWWNPCVYLLRRNLDHALEYKCDLSVTKAMDDGERVLYLQTLLDVLRRAEELPQSGETPGLRAGFCGISEAAASVRRFQLVLDRPPGRAEPVALLFMALTLVLFIGSYSVVIQPASAPPAEDLEHEILITPENSYILKTADGTYYLIFEGTTVGQISVKSLSVPPHCYLTIEEKIKEGPYE